MLTHACQEGKGVKLQGEGSKFCIIVSENPGAVGVDSGLSRPFACFGVHHILPLLSGILETGVCVRASGCEF